MNSSYRAARKSRKKKRTELWMSPLRLNQTGSIFFTKDRGMFILKIHTNKVGDNLCQVLLSTSSRKFLFFLRYAKKKIYLTKVFTNLIRMDLECEHASILSKKIEPVWSSRNGHFQISFLVTLLLGHPVFHGWNLK